jgi:HlyD family secretion protein
MNENQNETGSPPRQPVGKNKTAKYLPLAVIPALVIGGFTLSSCGKKEEKPAAGGAAGQQAPLVYTVETAPVSLGNVSQSLPVTGQLRTNQNISLQSKITGRIARVLVQEGERVRRGQLLVELDDADLRALVNAQRANVQTARVRLQQTIVGLPAKVQQVETSITQAETALATAQARYKQALLNEPAQVTATQNQVDTARETVRTAQARLRQARENADQTNKQTAAVVRQSESALESARAQVAASRSSVQREQAALEEVRRGARDQQIAQAQSQVTLAEAQARNAETELNRAKILAQGGAGPQAAVDQTQTAYDVAQAQLENARQNLSLVREGATSEQVRQAEASLRTAEDNVRQTQAGVTQALAALQNAQAGRGQVSVAQSEVTASLAALNTSQTGLSSAIANLAQVPITRQETRVAREAVDQARAQLGQARANRAQIPVARADVPAARAAVQTAVAQLEQAQVDLAYAKIYSPVNGVVNTKTADVGQTAGQGTTILNLVSLDRVYFEAQVSELQVRTVKAGQQAQISIPAVSDQPLAGYVTDVIPTANEQSRQFRIRVTIPSAPRELTPGAFARGTIITQQVTNTLVVPNDALKQDNGQSSLQLAIPAGKTSEVKVVKVRVGPSSGGYTQIVGSLEPGNPILKGDLVILGNQGLKAGDKVELKQ